MFFLSSRRRAFTIIELLIVITIIGILAAAFIPRLTGFVARGRDATRKADLQQIATALESYYTDHGSYPTTSSCVSAISGIASSFTTGIPDDPQGLPGTLTAGGSGGVCTSGGYAYYALNSGAGYLLSAQLETKTDAGDNVYLKPFSSLSTSATASTNLAAATLCSATTTCPTSNAVLFVLGR